MAIQAQLLAAQNVSVAPVHFAQSVAKSDLTQSFAINQENFASLAQKNVFESLKDKLIEINLETQINNLNPESFLEISIPILGMTDFIQSNAPWQTMPQQFASILALNGYGSKSADEKNNFPKPDYIVVKDIIGNEYEVLVGPNGRIDLPEDGLGKFSILSSITYMFGYSQVMGEGLASLHDVGAQSNVMYLLPPPLSNKPFAPSVKVVSFDESNHKVIESEKEFPILVQDLAKGPDSNFEINISNKNIDLNSL